MRSLGLRARVTLLFAGGAAMLTTSLAVVTYEIVRHSVLQERQRSAVRAAYFDAAVIRSGLNSDDADIVTALRSLDSGQTRRPLVRRDDTWYARSADDNLTQAVPTALVTTVSAGHPAVQRVRVANRPMLVVGLPLSAGDAFYEVQSLAEAQSTLRTVGSALTGVALTATSLAALLSWSVSRRALLPLVAISEAAERVIGGDYTTRVAESTDPDLRELTRSFNDMVTQVRKRIEREQRFAADVSHEFRSPLQTLAASIRVLLNRRELLEPRSAAALDLLAAEIERFSTLVQSLLELAKSEQPVQLNEVDLTELLHRSAARNGLPEDIVRIEWALPMWRTDEQRLERVLDNLLNNARQHGGGVVEVIARYDDEHVIVDVDDAGPGIPADERGLVFDRFGRGRAAHARGTSAGTGLGLALVAEHVSTLGGGVQILDRPGGGSRFRVRLPRLSAEEA
jgi:signal transduction histidine kinase